MKIFKNEAEMAKFVVDYLKDMKWEIYQEVYTGTGSIADIIATRGNLLWVLECKLSFSLKLLQQAYKHTPYANYVSVCTPSNSSTDHKILNFLEIGHLLVDRYHVGAYASPKFRRKISKRYWNNLCDEQKTFCEAGSANGGHFTPFKNTVMQFKNYVEFHPGCSMKEAMQQINHHYACDSTARTSIYAWIKSDIIKGVTLKKGKLYLEDKDEL